jgi:hypothetical protein
VIHLTVTVENTAELLATEAYGAGALLRWESAATETGTYAEGGTVALVSGVSVYNVWHTAGVVGTWYRTRISNAGATTFSPYSAPREGGLTSVVSITEVRALVSSGLSDVDLQVIIDREEAWLAGKVGVLTGERIDTFRPGYSDSTLYLRRRAESVVVTDDGVALVADTDYMFTPSTGALRRGSTLAPLSWGEVVTVTWTPADEAAIKRAVIELVRGSLGETGMDSEDIGKYSYTRGESTGRVGRAGLARSILLKRSAYSMRLHSAMEAS